MSITKIIRTVSSVLQGKRYVSDLKMVNGSLWWGQEGYTVHSFEPIKSTTAIGSVNSASAKIYFPTKIEKVGDPVMYRAQVKLHEIMLANQLEGWVNKINDHPFV